ncbi:MAG: hypothetical protein IKV22_05135 [Paludibacteraceae bacterium]|nr:hypothetical protein [Paludibacteraceae bacterium]
MKRFSIFCAALFAAVTSFAAVTYELNGGVTNDYGWTGKGEMFESFMTESGATGFNTLEYYMQQSDPLGAPNICSFLNNPEKAFENAEKWGWLKDYIIGVHVAQVADGATQLDATGAGSAWRYAVAAFFACGHRASWPVSANFASAGLPEAFMPAWKHGLANPTEPTAEFVLNTPYKEGATFDGWYAAADFSGEKVTKIDANTTGTLYAKWVEYIPTIAEVKALADDVVTNVSGVVNHIQGRNLYIQDATGGILVYTSEDPTCKVGDKIVAKGVKTIYGGAPEVKNAVINATEAAEVFPATSFETLAALVADSVEHKYFGTNVTIAGVTIAEYDSYNNPTVQDASGNKAKCYKMVLDPTAYPVGCKVTVTAVAAWYNGFQFVGDAKNIVRPIAGKKENYTFPVKGTYSLENNWVISNIEDNYAANKPGGTDYVRGMVAKDGIMYFINREIASIVRVDGMTGDMLDPIVLKGEHLFETPSVNEETGDTTWSVAVQYPYNDIKIDNAGNFLIGACQTSSNQPFFIYVVDIETGECTKLIEDYMLDNPGLGEVTLRFDAFGVAGDVTKNGVIMAADALQGSWNVYRWLITDGVAGEGEQINIKLDPAVDQSLYINAAGFYTAPQIFPQDEEGSLFYVDGFNTLPMLFYGDPDQGAMLLDDFINVPTGKVVTNNEGETTTMNEGHNGLVEFQVGEDYFLLMAATNTAGSPTSAFALFKFADEERAFEGMEPLWYFPHNGLGSATNGCRTAVPSVDVIDDNTAVLYIYANNNGYASYTLKTNATPAAVEDVEAVQVEAKKTIKNGQLIIEKNGVKYNALGAEVK